MKRASRLFIAVLALFAVSACKGGDDPCEGAACNDAATDGAPADAPDTSMPDTCVGPPGLYADDDCEQVASGLMAYEPKYWLWSDGLDKERYLFLPAGAAIDTSNPDLWEFPVGTRVYKNFVENGKRLETRLIERTAATGDDDGWVFRTFRWNHAQNEATEVFDGQADVLGTTHNIPSIQDCRNCHNTNAQDALLSVGAIQLNHSLPGATLASLTAAGRISMPISADDATIPGNATTQNALGYMHANCGNCHRPGGTAGGSSLPQLWVGVGIDDVLDTPAYVSTVDICTTGWPTQGIKIKRVNPMSPGLSAIWQRMGERDMEPPIFIDVDQMPPLATEVVDTNGRNVIAAWINSLADTPETTCP